MPACEIHGERCGAEEFPESELCAAAEEHSPIFDGIVLAEAIRIVCHRNRLRINQLAHAAEIQRQTLYNHSHGKPCHRRTVFHSMMVRLVIFEQEKHRG